LPQLNLKNGGCTVILTARLQNISR